MKKKIILTFMLTIMLMFTLTGCGAKVKTISIHGQKTEFLYGEDFSVGSNAVVTAYLDDNSQKTLKASEYEVDYSSFDNTKPGTYQIKVLYKESKDIYTTYLVSVGDKVISGISLSTSEQPRLIYYVGDELDLSVGKIKVTLESGAPYELSLNAEGVVVSGFNSTSAVNSQILKVAYAGFEVNYAIMISPKSATSLAIEVAPKLDYYVGDTIDRSVGSVKAVYVTGKSEVLPLSSSELTITGFNTVEAGEDKVVTISHAGKSITYLIDVIEPTLLSFELTPPTVTTYFIDQDLNLTGGEIVATFDNGVKTIPLNDDSVEISGFNSSNATTGQVITVTYKGMSKTFSVDIMKKSVTTISLAVMPRLNYYIDEAFDITNGVLKVNYNDGSEDNVSLDNINVTITGFDSRDVAQAQVVTIAYNGVTTTINVNILLKQIQRIEIVTLPNKTTYFIGQGLELDGLSLIAYHQLGSEDVNLLNVSATGFDSSSAINNQEITVTYMGASTTFNVNIVEKSATSLSFQTQPVKQYYVGDTLNKNAGSLFVEYDDGSNEVIPLKDSRILITGFNSENAVANQTITVKLDDKELTYTVTIFVKEVISIRINPPIKTEYFIGDEIDLTGLQIVAVYPLGEENVDMDSAEFTYSGFDSSAVNGEQEITINFGGRTASFYVSIIEKVVTRIAVNDDVKTRYFVGSNLDVNVGTIKVYYSNGVNEEIALSTNGVEVSGFNSESEFEALTLTINYEGQSCTYFVSVVYPKVSEILVTGLQTIYYTGDEFNNTQGVVALLYEDGSSAGGDISNLYTIEFDTTTAKASYTMVLGYVGLDITIEVQIEVVELVVTALEVKSNSKTIYCIGEEFDVDSVVIEVTSNKGKYNLDLTSKHVEFTGFDSSNENYNVTCVVSYMGQSVEFTVEVIEVEISSIEIVTLPRVNYYQQDVITVWDFTGGVIKATTSVGSSIYVDMTSSAVTTSTFFDLSETIEGKEVSVEYAGKQTTFAVNIYQPIVSQVSVITNYGSHPFSFNENGYEITLNGEYINSIDVILTDDNFTYTYDEKVINKYGEFEIVVSVYENDSDLVREFTIKVNVDYFDELLDNDFTYFSEELEIQQGVIELSTNKQTLDGFEVNHEYNIDQVIFGDMVYNSITDVELEFFINSIDVILDYQGSYILVTLRVTRINNLISDFTIDGEIYEVEDVQEFEFEYGVTHNFNFVYDDNLYKATINDELYLSSQSYEFKITKYISYNNELNVKIYTSQDYADYLVRLEEYKQMFEQFENGILPIPPQSPYEPNRVQEFKVIYGEYDYIQSVDFTLDNGSESYYVLDNYLQVQIEDFIKEFEVEVLNGYEAVIHIDTDSKQLEYGLNNVIVEVYNSQGKLVQIAYIDIYYYPSDVDGISIMVGEYDLFRGVVTHEFSEEAITYDVSMKDGLSMDVYYGDLTSNKRKTITSNYHGWYNADLGDNVIYFVVNSAKGSKVYVRSNIYTYAEEIVSGFEKFNALGNDELAVVNLHRGDVVSVRKSQVELLTKVYNEYGEVIDGAIIEWLDGGNTLKITYYDDNTYVAYYKVRYILELSITEYNAYLIDSINEIETEINVDELLQMNMSDIIYIETLDLNAVVVVESSMLMQVDENTFMVQNAGDERVVFKIIPADGNVGNIEEFTLDISVIRTEVFSVDFGGGVVYHAYQSLVGFDASSDFKVTYYDIVNENVTLNVTATISRDKLNITTENEIEYVTVNMSHLDDENGITIALTSGLIYLTSLDNVKIEIFTNSKDYEYVEFYYVIEQVIYHVVIVIEDVTPEFVFNLNFGDGTSSVSMTFVGSKILVGDFVAMPINGIMLEATIARGQFSQSVNASIEIADGYSVVFADGLDDGTPLYGDIVDPSNYNNLTLNINSQGEHGVIYAMLLKMDGQNITEQYTLMITISEDGSSIIMGA